MRRGERFFDVLCFSGILITVFFLPLGERLKTIGFFLGLVGWIGLAWRGRAGREVPSLGWALLGICAAGLFTTLASDTPLRSLRGLLDMIRYTLFFLIIYNTVRSEKRVRWIFWAAVAGIALGDLWGLRLYFHGAPELKILSLGDKNTTGQYLAMVLPLMMAVLAYVRFNAARRLALLTATGLTVAALLFTWSRGLWIAVAAAALLFMILTRRWQFPAAIAVAVAAISFGTLFNPALAERVHTLVAPLRDSSVQTRYQTWEGGVRMFRDHPWLGVGVRSFGLEEHKKRYQIPPYGTHGHNLLVNTAAEMGIVGVAAVTGWLAAYGYALAGLRRRIESAWGHALWLASLGCGISFLIGGIMHPMLGTETSLILTTILGLMLAMSKIEEARILPEPAPPMFHMSPAEESVCRS